MEWELGVGGDRFNMLNLPPRFFLFILFFYDYCKRRLGNHSNKYNGLRLELESDSNWTSRKL